MIDLNFLVQNIIDAVALGSLYALFSLGIALIFGVMRLINFAYGELIMVAAYTVTILSTDAPIIVIVPAAIGVALVFAIGMERIAFRPVRNSDPATLLITSFALSYLLQNLAVMTFGAFPRTVNVSSFLSEAADVGPFRIPYLNIVTLVVTGFLVTLLATFLAHTRQGLEMRAAAEDFTMARLLGVRADAVIGRAFALSGLLAGVASILLIAQTGVVSPPMGTLPVLIAFLATVIGGMGSLLGAVLGAFLLSSVTVGLQAYLPLGLTYYRDAFVYTAVIVVLLVRPQGLIVARSVETRI